MTNNSIEYFFINFFSNLYIHESKRTLIVGEKDYNVYRDVIECFLSYAIDDNFTEVKRVSKEIENIFYMNYVKDLLLFFKKKIQSEKFEFLKTKAIASKYTEVIHDIENEFNFSFGNDFKLRDEELPNHNCKIVVEDMVKVLKDFIEAKKLLQTYSITESIYEINTNSEEYFILKVIYSEFWNFLSHMAFALKFDEGINNYESNLNRATRHLERAVLDIYKFMLINQKLVDNEVLNARNLELKSFGQTQELSKSYIEYKVLIKKFLL